MVFLRLWAGDPRDPTRPQAHPEGSLSLDQLDRSGMVTRSQELSKQGNHLGAIKVLELAFAQNPKDAQIKSLIGSEYVAMKKDKEALPLFKEATVLNPRYEPAYLEMAKIYRARKNSYELRVLYQDMIERIGKKPAYITDLCELTTQEGQYALALEYCQNGIKLSSAEPRNYVYLGITYKMTDQPELALKSLKRAADLFSDSELAQLTLAEHHLAQKDWAKALIYFDRAKVANSQSLPGWLGFARMSFELQKYAQANQAFFAACEIDRQAITTLRRALIEARTMKLAEVTSQLEDTLSRCQNLPIKPKAR